MKKQKGIKKVLKIFLCVLLAFVLVVGSYLGYVVLSYSRIEDNQVIAPSVNAAEESVKLQTKYTVVTQNIGFGAYTQNFTFFMDGGKQLLTGIPPTPSRVTTPRNIRHTITRSLSSSSLRESICGQPMYGICLTSARMQEMRAERTDRITRVW